MHLANYARNQRALFETPSREVRAGAHRKADAHKVIAAALADGRETLTEPEAKQVLASYNIPVVETRTVRTPAEAGESAAAIGGSVALKILSRQITHKTDVGGVRLDLAGADAARRAAEEMLDRVRRERPDAIIDGFTVQQMVKRPHAQELLLGAIVDPTFGPCLMFGQGGVATEVIADRCLGLPPLSANLANDMISHTRVSRLLAGYRDREPARMEAIAAALVSLSDLVIDFPEIAELDINPLLADSHGVIALDARIIVRRVQKPPQLAIRPYPQELSRRMSTEAGDILLRPIRPEDSARLHEMAQRTDPADLRLRFHGAIAVADETMTTRLSQIDYDREMAFVAELPDGTFGSVVRLVFDPNFQSAECAIIVRSDLQHHGLGAIMLSEGLAYAGSRGVRSVFGDILAGNVRALELAKHLNGRISISPTDPDLVRVEFDLDPAGKQ
jgi:acetyltransferase